MRHQAIRNLYENVWSILTDENGEHAFDQSGSPVIYDEVKVQEEADRLQKEFLDNKYKSLRAKEYPSIKDFADAMFWADQGDDTKLNEYYSACQLVKDKYQKGTV
jgi:hypothetical protein